MSVNYSYQPAAYGHYSNGSIPGSVHNGYPGMTGGSNGTGFAFKKRFERVDWRKIAAVDVDNISRNLDFHTLQENIMNVTFCSIESEVDIRAIDPNFVKLFKLAQLTIEYLLHSQDYLSGMVTTLEEKLKKAIEEHEETKKALEKQKQEMTEVKKESHKRKKMLAAQQQIIHAGANSYHKCTYCSKAFVNSTFLQSHLHRRHSEYMTQYSSTGAIPQQTTLPSGSMNSELERELGEIKERLRLTESQLVEERNNRNSLSQQEHQDLLRKEQDLHREMQSWKTEQLESHKNEIEKLREMFTKELREVNDKYSLSEQALYDLQQKYGRPSNLGTMKDDIELEKDELLQQREEMSRLKEQVQSQVKNVEALMKSKLEDQEKRWKNKVQGLTQQHREQLDQLNNALEESASILERERQGKGHMEENYHREVKNLQQQAKKADRRLKERERQIEQLAKQPPPVRPRSPDVATKTTAPVLKMQPPSDEEEDEEEEEDGETTEMDGTSTMGTTGRDTGMSTTGSPFGTLSMGTLTQQSDRLRTRLKKDPNLLQGMREELEEMLETALQRRGISKDATGLSTNMLNIKLALLKTERQQKAKKHKNLYDIRQMYLVQVEDQARQRLKDEKRGGSPGPTGPPPKYATLPPRSVQLSASQHIPPRYSPGPQTGDSTGRGQQRAPSPGPQGRIIMSTAKKSATSPGAQRQPPKPAPRATSPNGNKLQGTMSTMSSTGRTMNSMATTGASSQWSTDEDDDDYETPRNQPKIKMSQPLARRSMSPEDDEESDWGSSSELDATSPGQTQTGVRPSGLAAQRPITNPQPKGKMVAELSRSIELQLQGRQGNKKPVGGVNTVMSTNGHPTKKKSVDFDDDDDDFSVSSLEEDSPPPPKSAARKTPTRTSVQGETDTSNTYGTSVWGGSSKGAPSPSPRVRDNPHSDASVSGGSTGNQGTVGKGSLVSVTDFDSEDDLELDEL